jgi:hypothetical protein
MDNTKNVCVPDSIRAALIDLEGTMVDSNFIGGDLVCDPTKYFALDGTDLFLNRAYVRFGMRRLALFTSASRGCAQWAYEFVLGKSQALRQSPWLCNARKLMLHDFLGEVASLRADFDIAVKYEELLLIDDNPSVVLNALIAGFGYVIWVGNDVETLLSRIAQYPESQQPELSRAIESRFNLVPTLGQIFFEKPEPPQ